MDRELIERIMRYIESVEETIDGEFGYCLEFKDILTTYPNLEGVLIYRILQNEIGK